MIEVASQTIAVHNLEYAPSGEIVDANGKEFDADAYSRMKYGSRDDTKKFASDIADSLKQEAPHLYETDVAPAFLVAYKSVVPACGYLTRYCLDRLNRERIENSLEPAEMMHVRKASVTNTDYSVASAEARQAELASIGFSLEGQNIDERSVVILDDIRISGGAEKRILEVIEDEPQTPSAIILGYIAVFDAQQAAISPNVESQINTTVVKDITDVTEIVDSEKGFDLNIRTLKLILGSEPVDIERLLEKMSCKQIEEIIRGATNTGPDFLQKYSQGYSYITQYFDAQYGAEHE